jgi:ESS family glutamate:Na+ symporter
MLIAKLMKEKLGIFKSIIIPNALLAGLLGLLAGPEVLGIINFEIQFYESLVFHFLGIGFIALTLSEKNTKQRENSINSGLFILSTYCFQAVLGMILLFIMINTFMPDLFFGLGLMLPLAFGQGPGFATAIGSSWEEVLNLGYTTQYGLTLATVGFLVGGLIGVGLLNYYSRKYGEKSYSLRNIGGINSRNYKITSVSEINFFDMLTTQIILVAGVYLLTYIIMLYLTKGLNTLGEIGATIGSLVKGFNYLFGIIVAILLKNLFQYLKKRKNARTLELTDGYLMHNLSSLSFNIMITSSVMAISIETIKEYWQLLILISTIAAVGTLIFVTFFAKKAFKNNHRLYSLAMFGMLTGTASTGLALLRGLDPNLESDVAEDLVLGSAIAAPLGIPLMVALSQPIIGYKTGNPMYYWITFGSITLYVIIIMTIMLYRAKKSRLNK